jgi:MFS family permease
MQRRHVGKPRHLPGNAFPLTVSAAIAGVGGALVQPYQSMYFSTLGADMMVIGSLLAFSSAITAIVQLVGGYVADCWGRRTIIVVFGFVGVASSLLFAAIPDASYLALPILLAAVSNIYGPAFRAMLVDSMHPHDVPRGMATFTFVTSLSSTICPAIGGWLLAYYGALSGLRLAFLLSAVFACLGVSYRAVKITETFPRQVDNHITPKQFVVQCFQEIQSVLTSASRETQLLLGMSILTGVATGVTAPYTALYATHVLEMTTLLYGFAMTGMGVTSVTLLPLVPRVIDRLGVKRSAITALFIIAINQFLFIHASRIPVLFIWSVLGGFNTALLTTSVSALQAEHSPREQRGRLYAVFNVLSLLTVIPAQMGGGYLYAVWAPSTPFLLSIPLFMGSLFILTKLSGASYTRTPLSHRR